ncbi:MAG: alpha-2-macroglobulin family protein, partial [Myxococcota bacterium]
ISGDGGRLTPHGGFGLEVPLPANAMPGYYAIKVRVRDDSVAWLSFDVQEDEPVALAAQLEAAGGPFVAGDSVPWTLATAYHGGGAPQGSRVAWRVTGAPPGHGPSTYPDYDFSGDLESFGATHEQVTDARGVSALVATVDGSLTTPVVLAAKATVHDADRTRYHVEAQTTVHPASRMVGLRTLRRVQAGADLPVDVVVLDLDEQPQVDVDVEVEVRRDDDVVVTCRTTTVVEGVARCVVVLEAEGPHTVAATVRDARGRVHESTREVWAVRGSEPVRQSNEVGITLDADSYRAGDVAEISIESPFWPAEALVVLSRDRILHEERWLFDGAPRVLSVPIDEAHGAGFWVDVELVGAGGRHAQASRWVEVDPVGDRLDVDVSTTEGSARPGSSTSIDVVVRRASGEPESDAELAVLVVDQAVSEMAEHEIGNPLTVFSDAAAGVTVERVHDGIPPDVTGGPEDPVIQEIIDTPMLVVASPSLDATDPDAWRLRRDFTPVAHLETGVRTDAQGRARVQFTLPDTVTTYRVTVLAVDRVRAAGKGETTLAVRQRLVARPALPRFLRLGDRPALSVFGHNHTDDPVTVDLAASVDGLSLVGAAGRRSPIDARHQTEWRFDAVAETVGDAVIRFAATSGDADDLVEVTLPVHPPWHETVDATYGAVEGGAVRIPLAIPDDVAPDRGRVEITASRSLLPQLAAADQALRAYPWECSEQLSSRILGLVALEGLTDAPPPRTLVQEAIDTLLKRRRPSGRFDLWPDHGLDAARPFVTVHATHALLAAKQAGYAIPDSVMDDLRSTLERVTPEAEWEPRTRATLEAYRLHGLHRLGASDAPAARALVEDVGLAALATDALGWLLPVLEDEATVRELRARAVETAGTARFERESGHWALFQSSRRGEAVALGALVALQPDDPLVDKLVRGLLDARVQGAWGTPQDDALVAMALRDWAAVHELPGRKGRGRVWIGDTLVGTAAPSRRGSQTWQMPLHAVLEA